jgi:Phosphopantetheine attachment site.
MTSKSSASLTTAEIEEFVSNQILSLGAEVDIVSPEASLNDLGLDSLDVVELCQNARKSFGLDVTPKDFADATTVSAVVEVIARAKR